VAIRDVHIPVIINIQAVGVGTLAVVQQDKTTDIDLLATEEPSRITGGIMKGDVG